jgi:hypothetical protein
LKPTTAGTAYIAIRFGHIFDRIDPIGFVHTPTSKFDSIEIEGNSQMQHIIFVITLAIIASLFHSPSFAYEFSNKDCEFKVSFPVEPEIHFVEKPMQNGEMSQTIGAVGLQFEGASKVFIAQCDNSFKYLRPISNEEREQSAKDFVLGWAKAGGFKISKMYWEKHNDKIKYWEKVSEITTLRVVAVQPNENAPVHARLYLGKRSVMLLAVVEMKTDSPSTEMYDFLNLSAYTTDVPGPEFERCMRAYWPATPSDLRFMTAQGACHDLARTTSKIRRRAIHCVARDAKKIRTSTQFNLVAKECFGSIPLTPQLTLTKCLAVDFNSARNKNDMKVVIERCTQRKSAPNKIGFDFSDDACEYTVRFPSTPDVKETAIPLGAGRFSKRFVAVIYPEAGGSRSLLAVCDSYLRLNESISRKQMRGIAERLVRQSINLLGLKPDHWEWELHDGEMTLFSTASGKVSRKGQTGNMAIRARVFIGTGTTMIVTATEATRLTPSKEMLEFVNKSVSRKH